MRHFNLVKSLTRVINNYKGLLILCAITSTFGVESAWGHDPHTGKIEVKAVGKGKVYIGNDKTKTSDTWSCGGESSKDVKEFTITAENTTEGWTFSEWDDGGAATHTVKPNAQNGTTTYIATFTATFYAAAYAKADQSVGGGVWISLNGNWPSSDANYIADDSSTRNLENQTSEPTIDANYDAKAKTGYTFKGWFTSTSGSGTKTSSEAKYVEKLKVTSQNSSARTSITRYAYFTPNTYTIAFNGNGNTGGSTASVPATYDQDAILPENGFTKTGYTFVGWKLNNTGDTKQVGDKVKNLTAAQGETVTYYAQWSPNNYHLHLDFNGGTKGTATTYDNTLTYNTSNYNDVSWTVPTREGYTFLGFYENSNQAYDADGHSVNGKYWLDKNYIFAGDLTASAKWQINTHSLSWDFAGGSTSSATYTKAGTYDYNTPITYPADETMSRAGYTFNVWDKTITTMPDGNVTITAQWTAHTNTPYTVKHYFEKPDSPDSYSDPIIQNLTGTTDTEVTPDYYEHTGYKAPDKQTVNIDGDGSQVVKYYYKVNSYILTWDGKGGTVNGKEQEVQTVKYGSPLSSYRPLDANVKRDGYDFVGWDPAVDPTMLAYNLTYTALWEAKGQDISFVANHSTGSNPSPIQGKVGQPYGTLPQPGPTTFDKPGYSFDGWFTAASGGTKVESTSLVEAGITTLYAHWTPKTYTVTFHPGEGGTVDPISKTVTFDAAYGTLPTPVRNGYVFGGWWTDATGGTEITATTTFNIAGNVDRYAHWTALTVDDNTTPAALTFTEPGEQTVTVNFTVSGGTLDDYTSSVTGDGWSFVEWSINGKTITIKVKFTATATTPQTNNGTVTLTSKASTASSRTANVSANVTLTPSLTADPNPLDFGTVVRGSGATTKTIAISGTNVVEWNFAELSAPWSIVKKDNSTIEVTFNPQSETAVGAIEKTFDITYKNAQTPITTNKLTITLKANVTLSEATTEWRGGEEFYVEGAALNINDNSVWYSDNTSNRTFEITNWTPTGSNNAGAHQPAITADNKLSLGQAGTLTLIMHQPADASYNAVDVEQNIEIKKRENTISVNPNTFTLTANTSADITISSNNSQTPFVVEKTQGGSGIAKYENGKVYALFNTGTAVFTVSQAENYKYNKASGVNFSVTTQLAGAGDCPNLGSKTGNWDGSEILWGKENSAEALHMNVTYTAKSWISVLITEPSIIVYEKVNDQWATIFAGEITSSNSDFTIPLSRSARGVKMTYTAGTGTVGGPSATFGAPYVTSAEYLDLSKEEIDLDPVDYESSQSGSFDVSWNMSMADGSNPSLSVESDNPLFTVDKSSISASECTSGSTTIKFTFNADKSAAPGNYEANIGVFNKVYSKSTHVTISVNKITPVITWDPDELVFNKEDELVATAYVDAPITVSATGFGEFVKCEGNVATMLKASSSPVTITAHVDAFGNYAEKTETRQITITDLQKQYINWDQSLRFKTTDAQKSVTLNATSTSGLPITYALSGTTTGLGLTQNGDTWTLTYNGEVSGAFITASCAGNATYAAAAPVNMSVKVVDPTKDCEMKVWKYGVNPETGHDYGTTGLGRNESDTWQGLSIPDVIHLAAKKTSDYGIYTNNFFVSIYDADGKTLVDNREFQANAMPISVDFTNIPTAYRVVCTSKAGSGFTITDLYYTKQKYCNLSTDKLSDMDIRTKASAQRSFTVDWANYPLEVTINNPNFKIVTETSFGDCDMKGKNTVAVQYTAGAVETTDDATIYVKNNKGTIMGTVTVHVNVTKESQTLTTNIADTYITTDKAQITTTSSATRFTTFDYSFNPTGIAHLEGNYLVFDKAGEVDITVSQSGDDEYNPASITKHVAVTAVDPTLSVNSLSLNYLDVLNNSQLSGCTATTTLRGTPNTPVEGTFSWGAANPAGTIIEDAAGTKSVAITFTPSDGGMYNTVTKYFTIPINHIDPTFTMSDSTINVTVDESHPTTIDLTSLIATLPEKNPMNKSEFTFKNGDQPIEKMFYATAAGEYNLTATSPQTNYYNPASQNFKVTVNKLTPTISGSDVTGKLVEDVFTADYTFVNVSGTPSSSSEADFYYTINNDVVSYDPANNQITCLKEGKDTITFTQKETTQFTAATKSFTITVSKKTTTFAPSWDASQTYSIQVGHSVNVGVTNVENDWGTDFAYTVTPADVFEVTRSANTITFTAKKACDNASVQLKQNATVRYSGLDKTYNFVVTRIPNTLEVASTAKTLYVCDTWDNIISEKNSGAALQVITDPTSTDIISYNTEANSIAAQDEGTVKITFKQEATDEYEGATKSIDITVRRHRIKLTSSLSGTVTNGQTLSQTILTGTMSATTDPAEYTPSKEEPIEGRWDWATPEEPISEPTATIQRDYVFTPADLCFQTNNTIQVTIAINKATPVIKNYPTGTLVMTAEETLNMGVNTASVPEQCWAEVNGVKISGTVAWMDGDEPKLMDAKFGFLIFTPTDKLTYNDANPQSVSIQVNSIPRSITWDQEGLDQIPADKPFTMTAEASGITSEVKYEIVEGEQGIATIDGDRISFSCHGTVKVMATTIPNPNYSQDTTYQTLTAIVVEPELNVTASAITYGATVGSSTLQLGANDPAGTLSWKPEDASKMPDAGTYNYIVSYTPASESECKFKPTTTEVSLTVNKAASLLTWKENITGVLYVGQTVTTYPDSVTTTPSGLAVTFTVPEGSDVITIENNGRTLRADKEGTVEVTPRTEGNSNYAAADGTPKLFTVKATTDPVFTPSWTVGDQPYLMYIDQTETISMLNVSPADDENFTYTVTPADAMQLTRSGDVITLKATKAYDAVTVTLKQTATVSYRAAEKSFSFKTSKITPTIAWNTSVPTTVNAGSGVTITPSFIATDPISGATIDGVEWTYSIIAGDANAKINANKIECLHYGLATVKAQMAAKGEKYTAAEGTQVVTFTALTDVITWKGDIPVYAVGETLPNDLASSASGLTITYSSSDESIVDASLKAIVPGTIVLTASTPGNNFYLNNESTHDIVVKDHRTITWTQDLSAIPAVGTFALTATVDKGLQDEIVYYVDKIEESTGDAKVAGHTLTPSCAGKVNIRVTLVPNDLYFDTDPMSKEATIVLVEPTLNNISASDAYASLPLSTSTLTYEGIEGALTWVDGTTILAYPGGTYPAHFTPAAPCQYQEKDVDVHVTVNKLIPTITWTCETEYQTDQDSIPLCFVVTSPTGEVLNDIELTYASENEDIATIVKNHAGQWVLHVKSAGDVTITATSTETDIYASEKGSADIHYQKMLDEIVWNGGEPIPSFEANAYIPHGIAQSKNDPNDPNMKVTYTSDNTSVIMIGDDGIIHTVNSGKANLTARTSGNAKFDPVESTMEITVSKRQLTLVWDQIFLNFDESHIGSTMELVASVVDPSSEEVKQYPITFSFAAEEGTPASIDGTILSIKGTGKGTIIAHVTIPEADKALYDDVEEKKSLRVRVSGEKCNTEIFTLSRVTINKDRERVFYHFGAPGSKITMKLHRNRYIGTGNNRHFYISVATAQNVDSIVKQLADFPIENMPTNATDVEYDFSDCPNARYLIFEFNLGGISDKEVYVEKVSITQNSFISSPTTKIDELAFIQQHWSDTIALNYSDVPAVQVQMLHGDQSGLTIEPVEDQVVENDCGDFGTYKYILKGFWIIAKEYKDTIRFYTIAGDELKIPVHFNVQAIAEFKFTNGVKGDGDGLWSTPTNWLYGNSYEHGRVPESYNNVAINAPVTINGTVEIYQMEANQNITIEPQASLTIWEGGFMGMGNVILQASIDPETKGQAYFRRSPHVQLPAYDNMPNAIVQLATRSTLNTGANRDATWQYIGIPVENLDFNVDYITWLYRWDEQNGWIDYKAISDRTGSAPLKAWEGYAITQYGQPIYEFSGKLLNNNQTITLSRTETQEGMCGNNLFANSYASPIDVKRFTEDDFEGDLDKTFYIFNSGSWNQWDTYKEQIKREQGQTLIAAPGQYIAIPALTAKGLDESYDQTMIAPMQGIYVVANEDGAQIKLNYEKHVWNAKPKDSRYSQMNNPARAPKADTIVVDTTAVDSVDLFTLNRRVRMVAYGENSGADFVYVMEHNDYTRHYDNGCDAPKMFADVDGILSLYTNEENTGLMSVAATNDVNEMFIGFNAGEDVNYKLFITSVIGDDLELMDMQTGDRFALKDSASYEFAATPNSEDPYRFRIFKSEKTPVVPTGWTGLGDKAKIWYNKQVIYISDAAANSTASIYTAAGELLEQVTFNHNTTISTQDIPEGVYTVRVEDSVLKFFVKH